VILHLLSIDNCCISYSITHFEPDPLEVGRAVTVSVGFERTAGLKLDVSIEADATEWSTDVGLPTPAKSATIRSKAASTLSPVLADMKKLCI